GMREPEVVRAATGEYAADMDEVGKFIDECCELGPDFVEDAGELYRKFYEVTGSEMTQHAFGARLGQKKFLKSDPRTGKECRTKKGRRGRKGLRLRPDAGAAELDPILARLAAGEDRER